MPVIRIGTSWTRPNGVRYYDGSSWVAPKAVRYYNGSARVDVTESVYNPSGTLHRVAPSGPLSQSKSFVGAASVGGYALFAGGSIASSSLSNAVDAYNNQLVKSTPTDLSGDL